jgi:hypothetical protein
MGRERGEQVLPDLFSMDAVRDASTPQHATTDATAEPKPQRHILPKNLRNAVEHLSDGELDLLHTATFEELKRRGRLPPSVGADAEHLSRRRLNLHRRQTDLPQVSLTRGQVNAVRAAFKAGITLSRIARQFGISQSNVRKALAIDEPKG